MPYVPPEIQEKILLRSSVRDVIRCKSVCKSWRKLISDPQFTKARLKHSYDIDRNNDTFGSRRITMTKYFNYLMSRQYNIDDRFFDLIDRHLLGSSNGLVCVSPSPTELVIINPATREVNELTKPEVNGTESMCWGFGHDSSTDDYKVLCGYRKGKDRTCLQVFSLRLNTWKVLGVLKFVFLSSVGILCEEALHFVAYDTSKRKKIICAYDFAEERFREVLQADDCVYNIYFGLDLTMRLGVIEDCLCAFISETFPDGFWIMKEYDVKESWQCVENVLDFKYDVVHSLKHLVSYIPNEQPLCHGIWPQDRWLCENSLFVGVPLYVESLVSPHFHKLPETERQATNTIESSKDGVLSPSDTESLEKVKQCQSSTSFGGSTSAGV